MRHSKCVPQNDVGVVDAAIRVRCYPSGNALRWIARSLRDVATRGVDLVVRVYRDGKLVGHGEIFA
jgi:hypothetical protein